MGRCQGLHGSGVCSSSTAQRGFPGTAGGQVRGGNAAGEACVAIALPAA